MEGDRDGVSSWKEEGAIMARGGGKGEELTTTAKMAAEWGVSAGEVRKAVKAAGVKPDAMRGACAYYSRATAGRIRKVMGK